MKFDIGDVIVPAPYYHGFDEAKVTGFKKIKGKQYYTLKIMNGTATIPVSAEVYYQLKSEK